MTLLISQRFELETAAYPVEFTPKLKKIAAVYGTWGKDVRIYITTEDSVPTLRIDQSLVKNKKAESAHGVQISLDGNILFSDHYFHGAPVSSPAKGILRKTWTALEIICSQEHSALVDGVVNVNIAGDKKDVMTAYDWFGSVLNAARLGTFVDQQIPRAHISFSKACQGYQPHRLSGGMYSATVPLTFDGDIRRKRKRA